ncbi:hypothetical protein H6F74_26980 [Trichocoleus sp. FACHB-90]|uniref:hypothetical protein n=1 Tax=Cyanophyceae TaxID=3028117 RepID=UPI00168A005D|nr:hypothetical protein [Trichocoleus sp. FACHB-90]MBD1929849.1 hypothetical protein [Trichocoleus sp. FACHB-90]
MLRIFRWMFALSAFLITLTTKAAFSLPASQVQSHVDTPFCYMQTANGQMVNLETLCGKSATVPPANNTPVSSTFPPIPSNLSNLSIPPSGLAKKLKM